MRNEAAAVERLRSTNTAPNWAASRGGAERGERHASALPMAMPSRNAASMTVKEYVVVPALTDGEGPECFEGEAEPATAVPR